MAVNRSTLLANLVTVCNGICGFAAVVLLMKVEVRGESGEFVNPENFTAAAWLVLLGMVFDVFDGRIARLSKGTTELGAQLDSFCDLVTFGLVPAVMIVRLNMGLPLTWRGWQNVVWFFSLAYFLGALLRLARFNAEHSPDEGAHLAFKGLPTPAAAGCIASLVIFQRYIDKFEADELVFLARYVDEIALKECVSYIIHALPFLGLFLGFTMVWVQFKYEHVGNKLFRRVQSFDTFVYLVFGAILLALRPQVVLPIAFLGYLLWTPVNSMVRRVWQKESRAVSHERS